jgi:hypothetical protein
MHNYKLFKFLKKQTSFIFKFFRNDFYFNAYASKIFNSFWNSLNFFLFFNLKHGIIKKLNTEFIKNLMRNLNKITQLSFVS